MKSWVSESSMMQMSTDISRISMNGMKPQKTIINKSRKAKLEAELKLLEWHKLANDAALKAALLQTKSLKQESPGRDRERESHQHSHAAEDALWIRRVIDEEQVKPLEVTRDYVLEYEKKEKENSLRLASQVERHVATLRKLRDKLESRQETKSRTQEYRSWQKEFEPKKQAVIMGKTLSDQGIGRLTLLAKENAKENNSSSSSPKKQEVSAVLDSLTKLSELESRIANLEHENVYDYLLSKEQPSKHSQNTSDVDFKRRRVNVSGVGQRGTGTGTVPMSMKYTVLPRKAVQKWRTEVVRESHDTKYNTGVSYGSGISAARTVRVARTDTNTDNSYRDVHGGGVFLTGVESDVEEGRAVDEAREKAKRERSRKLANAPLGEKNLRSRVAAKKRRAKEISSGTTRHLEAMNEMAKRKAISNNRINRNQSTINQINRIRPIMAGTNSNNLKGASSGLKTKNKYLADFEKLKATLTNKRDGHLMSRTLPVMRQQNSRVISGTTSPSFRRMPTVQSSGTVTRRTLAPSKRISQTDNTLNSSINYNELNSSNKYNNATRIHNNNSENNSGNNNNNNKTNNSCNRNVKQNPSPSKTNSNSNSNSIPNLISVGGVSGLRVLRSQKTFHK